MGCDVVMEDGQGGGEAIARGNVAVSVLQRKKTCSVIGSGCSEFGNGTRVCVWL